MTNQTSAAIVYHTGSMIRFTTSQLSWLPLSDRVVEVILPHGELVQGKFTRNPYNPFIGGRKLVRWIKSQIAFGETRAIDVTRLGDVFIVKWPRIQAVQPVPDQTARLEKVIKQLLKIAADTPARRRMKYASYLQRAPVARFFKELFGDRCQVENCEFTRDSIPEVSKYVTEVHHLEHLSAGGSNQPLNLSVLCANHHSLYHRDPEAKILSQTSEEVVVHTTSGTQRIVRDLAALEVGI